MKSSVMCRYSIISFNPSTKDWERDKVHLHPRGVREWLLNYERAGFLYPYEVLEC